jgi:hypothetical protein
VDFREGIPGYFEVNAGGPVYNQKFGKVNIFPYLTNKDYKQMHPLAQMWVDELIISRNRIADPAATSASPNRKLTLVANTAVQLGPYSGAAPDGDAPSNAPNTTAYSGIQYDPTRRQMVFFGGGHAASNSDAVNTFSLDALKWSAEYVPTPRSKWTFDNYDFTLGAWKSGPSGPYPRPAARHTEDELAVVGDELIVFAKVEGNYPNLVGDWSKAPAFTQDASHWADTAGRIAHYNFVTKTWSFAPVSIPDTNWPAVSYDPPSGKVLILGRKGLFAYDPGTKMLTRALDLIGDDLIHDEDGAPVDASLLNINQSMVYFPPNGKHYYLGNLGTVFEVTLDPSDLTKSKVVKLTTTGAPPPGSAPEVNGAAYDSANQLIGVGPYQNAFYAFNPVTKSWASKAIPQAPGSLAFHCLDYDPVNNAYIFITTDFSTWAYRYQ